MNILFFLKPKSELAYIYDYHTVRQALEIMEYHKYSSVPILSKDGRYIGSITEGDLLWSLKRWNLLKRPHYFRLHFPIGFSIPKKKGWRQLGINCLYV